MRPGASFEFCPRATFGLLLGVNHGVKLFFGHGEMSAQSVEHVIHVHRLVDRPIRVELAVGEVRIRKVGVHGLEVVNGILNGFGLGECFTSRPLDGLPHCLQRSKLGRADRLGLPLLAQGIIELLGLGVELGGLLAVRAGILQCLLQAPREIERPTACAVAALG